MGVSTAASPHTHALRCKCGALQGHVDTAGTSNRVICYCISCQLFAHFLGSPKEILDRHGGTEIIQVAASSIRLTTGTEHLAAIRLTEGGLVRWYAACCRTPIGNTLENYKLGFIGLIHSCLDSQPLVSSFGELAARLNTASAIDEPKPTGHGMLKTVVRILAIILSKRLSGNYRKTAFFTASGAPVAVPRVLKAAELQRLRDAL
ncbi:MAG TPA: DUF6151 family protein [Halioglobus sp.]